MLDGVNDVLTPWTPSRILRIMEAASAARSMNRSGSDRALSGSTDEGAMAMESLLRLSNQQPDVAARVMAAPLFAQRPLVEATDSASNAALSSSSVPYADAHRMCTHTLELCRAGWKDAEATKTKEEDEKKQVGQLPASLPPSPKPAVLPVSASPYATETELEEMAFAAEFAEPCLRGAFPDVGAVVRHSLPAGCASLLRCSRDDGAEDRSGAKSTNAVQRVVHSLLQEPAVSHRKPSGEDEVPISGSSASICLNMTRPTSAAPSHALLWSSLPLPSAVPIEAYGPPSHKVFDSTSVAHSFTEAEVNDLHGFLAVTPRPFQVYCKSELKARRRQASHYQRRNAMLSAGAGAAPIVGPQSITAGTSTLHAARQRSHAHVSRDADDEQDGWSASSGWSSSCSNSTEHNGESDGEEKGDDAEGGKGPEASARRDDATALPRLTAVEEEGMPAVDQSAAPTPPLPNRTWIEDDGELVLENGKILLRKRKLRVLRNPPPLLPLPTMVRGPVLRQPSHTAFASEAAVVSVEEEQTGAPVQKKEGSSKGERKMEDVSGLKEEVEEQPPATRRRGAVAKRERALADDGDESAPPTTAKSRRGAKHANTKKSTSKRNTSADEKSSSPTLLNTANAPRLSESEMLGFVERLSISDLLRKALLIGVQDPSASEKEESRETREDNPSSSASEK
ncbi:hypothetical protein ABB37_07577 [Leptomonas pyrrhocoris]|uniref:Uncharacterized protein n=1 Tax=Leptomonas pyrrhocoris TaxID=157538 RepID=A0A0M9FV68_LEPPY|nr:hypothetical protein ABB37_07577 [Leptomonas pyrrhocoris]KPA76750.1 hypothetical protein ABB37_07577 [Leptomonas pyrrhocoris]|eukprot:XP_015655189.1 hypothetical protein ABB37_07577 [Leptomonas pyrrhocoris]